MRLLVLAVLVPSALFAAPKRPSARETLRAECMLHAADPKNPWALAHGVTGLGKSFAAADGRLATAVIVSDFLEQSPQGTLAFRRYAADRTPIDPHTNLLVKTLVQAGLPDSQSFHSRLGPVTLGRLVADVKKDFRHVPQSEAYWQDVGWTLDLLASRLTPRAASFQNGAGETVDFNGVMDDALAYLEVADKELAEGLDRQLPEVPKRKQGIYAHSCGGLHLVQAVFHWARFPEVRKRWGRRLDRQIDILFYRLGSEQRQYEAALRQAPQYRLQLLTQMLKFYGHFLETTGRLRKELPFKPTAAQQRELEKARALLDWTVGELVTLGAYEKLDALRSSQPQLSLDLIGDSCHAANGLELWK